MPFACEPEAAVVVALAHEADGADDFLRRVVFEAEHPVPFVAAGDSGECVGAVVELDAVFREGPWDSGVELFDDLPLGEEGLDFGGVGEGEWAENEAWSFEGWGGWHGGGLFNGCFRGEFMECGRALPRAITHLSDDKTVAKMGHPVWWLGRECSVSGGRGVYE